MKIANSAAAWNPTLVPTPNGPTCRAAAAIRDRIRCLLSSLSFEERQLTGEADAVCRAAGWP
jgi:hypothetical protein